jgi:hypothetical protein
MVNSNGLAHVVGSESMRHQQKIQQQQQQQRLALQRNRAQMAATATATPASAIELPRTPDVTFTPLGLSPASLNAMRPPTRNVANHTTPGSNNVSPGQSDPLPLPSGLRVHGHGANEGARDHANGREIVPQDMRCRLFCQGTPCCV